MAKKITPKETRAGDKNGMSDPMVVSTAELKEAIERWAEHRNFPLHQRDKFSGLVSLSKYLENESGQSIRKIWSILNGETKVTTYAVADAIMSALERPDLMPAAIPNPRWSQVRWQEYMEERGCI